jgi:hypothetical protein
MLSWSAPGCFFASRMTPKSEKTVRQLGQRNMPGSTQARPPVQHSGHFPENMGKTWQYYREGPVYKGWNGGRGRLERRLPRRMAARDGCTGLTKPPFEGIGVCRRHAPSKKSVRYPDSPFHRLPADFEGLLPADRAAYDQGMGRRVEAVHFRGREHPHLPPSEAVQAAD